MVALSGRETLYRRATEQSCRDGGTVVVVVIQCESHLILIAYADTWQVGVGKRQQCSCSGLGIAVDSAILCPFTVVAGFAHHLEGDARC